MTSDDTPKNLSRRVDLSFTFVLFFLYWPYFDAPRVWGATSSRFEKGENFFWKKNKNTRLLLLVKLSIVFWSIEESFDARAGGKKKKNVIKKFVSAKKKNKSVTRSIHDFHHPPPPPRRRVSLTTSSFTNVSHPFSNVSNFLSSSYTTSRTSQPWRGCRTCWRR